MAHLDAYHWSDRRQRESEEGIVGIMDGRDKESRDVVKRDQQDMAI